MKQLIAITTPTCFPGEGKIITSLFKAGLERLHLRKPDAGKETIAALIHQIPDQFYSRIVIHDHFSLASEYALGGVHLNRRNPNAPEHFTGSISRSCHSIQELDTWKSLDYLFLSPIFQSISKEGYGSGFPLDGLRNAKGIIDDKVIALGGICLQTITKLRDIPFGGVAVLGALWGNDPSLLVADQLIKQFKRLQVWP